VSLSEWLASNGCTHVAMEATGVYWKPVWHILSDSEFTLVPANAAHVKNVQRPRSLRFTKGMTATPVATVARLNWGASDGGSEGMASSIFR
jgi:Transposase